TMEDKVIIAVCAYPELYDTSLYFYRSRNKKDLAWKKVSEEVGQSEEVCRKKWKSLRDAYLKERRKKTEKRSWTAAGLGEKWKYSAVLSFLDPFVSPRETSGNMERGPGRDKSSSSRDELFLLSLVSQRRRKEQPSEVECQLLEALQTRPVAPAPPPCSEDELFLLSLVPFLQRLPPQTKEFVKFQIHKLIYESSTVLLNLEQLEPQD
uniref:Transcription factor Adf-1 n=1 Tax=Cyprinus carpio TaxID=7962 RepID=A0A8C1MZ46_CYPCA